MKLSNLHDMDSSEIIFEKLYRKLKDYIHSRNLNYRQIGAITGFSPDHISKIVTLKRNPSYKFIRNMSLALQVPPTKLGLNVKVPPERRSHKKKKRGRTP
jgi:transcriptional regulator with XRE-family HTH domain